MRRSNERSDLHTGLDELAATKLAPQDRDEGHIVRQDLMTLLDDVLRHRLTVVHAGAGYGKTSLLMQWLKEVQRRRITAAWLTLEEDEASPSVCLAHMFAAIAKIGYVNNDPLSGLVNFDEKMSVKSLATAFINTVAENSEPLVIFLDEFNRAQSEELSAMFKTLMRQLPRHVHFIIASRWRPEIDIENFRARGDLIEVTAHDLRFSRQEVAALLASSGAHLSELELHRLTDRTEGWPIALQMARMWLNGDGQKARLVSDFSGRTMDLTRYLSEQVLSALPEETQSFLMQTAILDRLNGDIANALTDRRDGWLMLEQLYERDLFLVPENDDRQWFRYHMLFLDFLRDRLQRYGAEAIAELHRRAADWLAGHGMTRAAVHHALKAGDYHLAARLLSDAGGWRLIMDGRINMIRSAIAGFPDAIVREYLLLSLAKAFLLVKDGDVKAALDYFHGLEKRPTWSAQESIDYEVVAHVLADYADEPMPLAEIERVKKLRQEIHKNDHVLHAILADSLATKYYEYGSFKQALEACDDAISHYRVLRSLYGEVFLRFTQAKAHLAQGRLDDAEQILRGTEKELEVRFGDGIDLSAHTSIYLAEVLAERGLVEEAAKRLRHALPVAEQSDGWYELYATAYSAAAAVAWAEHGLDAALAALDRTRAMARERHLDRLLLLADCQSVYYLFLSGRTAELPSYVPRLRQFLAVSIDLPSHRSVCLTAASLAMIHVAGKDYDAAKDTLTPCVTTAETNGDICQLIMLTLLQAAAASAAGRTEAAARAVDKAVRDGLFTGILRPYLEHGRRLKPVIEAILHGGSSLPQDRYRDNFLRELLRDLRRLEKRQASEGIVLTSAELAVLRELDHGFSNKEIALKLGISPNTVKYRMKSLFAKLGVSQRAEAVKVCREQALLSNNPAD